MKSISKRAKYTQQPYRHHQTQPPTHNNNNTVDSGLGFFGYFGRVALFGGFVFLLFRKVL